MGTQYLADTNAIIEFLGGAFNSHLLLTRRLKSVIVETQPLAATEPSPV